MFNVKMEQDPELRELVELPRQSEIILAEEELHFKGQQKVFMEFACIHRAAPVDEVMNASIFLLKKDATAHVILFEFYHKLISEYCHEYCIANGKKRQPSAGGDDAELKREALFLPMFIQALNPPEPKEEIKVEVKDETCEDVEMKEALEDGPQSPTQEDAEGTDLDKRDLIGGGLQPKKSPLSIVMGLLDEQLNALGDALSALQTDSDYATLPFTIDIADWSLEEIAELSKALSSYVVKDPDASLMSAKFKNEDLMNALSFWLQCPGMQCLLRAIITSAGINRKTDAKTLIRKLLAYSPHSDWILAYLCTNISPTLSLTDYIEELIARGNDVASFSIPFILSYVSEHNPQAIVNCSKSNLPLLLKLCTNSKPLLDLLAYDVIRKVDVQSLNRLAGMHTSQETNDYIIYCLLNAPNAFEFLKLSFDLFVHPHANETLRNRILDIIKLVEGKIHTYLYAEKDLFPIVLACPIIALLRDNICELITHPSIAKSVPLQQRQLRLLKLICMCYATEFITVCLHHLMNFSTCSISLSNYESIKLNRVLEPLYNSLRMRFGFTAIQDCIKDTVQLHLPKKTVYWASLSKFLELQTIPLKITDLFKFLNQRSFDRYENTFRKHYVLKIVSHLFDTNQSLFCGEQYRLCTSLVRQLFEMTAELQEKTNPYMTVTVHSLTICQKLLADLSANFSINEFIITCSLLDFAHAKSNLFKREYIVTEKPCDGKDRMLLDENSLRFGHTHKPKKSRLLPISKANQRNEVVTNLGAALYRQMFIDLLQSCVRDKVMFSRNLVRSLSGETLLHDTPWMLEEDPKDGQIQHLRMTFEKDLYITRQFDEKPIFWNIFEIISRRKYLQNCMVIVRALINVQRANLASSLASNSFREQNTRDVQKIIRFLANNEVLPEKPFIFTWPLASKLKNWEMSYVLHDIAKYIRDCGTRMDESSMLQMKPYLQRLRLILAHHHPDETFVKIFKTAV